MSTWLLEGCYQDNGFLLGGFGVLGIVFVVSVPGIAMLLGGWNDSVEFLR